MVWTAVIVLVCNVGGAGLMARFGLPSVVPLIGRKDSDNSAWGMLGLVLFVTSIAVRLTAVMSNGWCKGRRLLAGRAVATAKSPSLEEINESAQGDEDHR